MAEWIAEKYDPAELQVHPTNIKLYGHATIDGDLLRSIKEHGIIDPIRIVNGGTILAGHRRVRHAVEAGLKSVPVLRYSGPMNEYEQIVKIIEYNRYRLKTGEQLMREGAVLYQAKAELAKLEKGGRPPKTSANVSGGFPKSERESLVSAAKEVGLSKDTLARGMKAVAEIDRLEAEGQTEKADEIRQVLNKKGAAPAARAAGVERPSKPKTTYDDGVIDGIFGKLVRALNERAKRLNYMESAYHKRLKVKFDLLYREWKEIRKETRK